MLGFTTLNPNLLAGVRVNPLEHGSLPDSEAAVIRTLVDRIESLEQQLQELQAQSKIPALVRASSSESVAVGATHTNNGNGAQSCRLRDREIQQFLDGSGI